MRAWPGQARLADARFLRAQMMGSRSCPPGVGPIDNWEPSQWGSWVSSWYVICSLRTYRLHWDKGPGLER